MRAKIYQSMQVTLSSRSSQRNQVRAVERRAEGLTEAYAKSAREVDWRYCGTSRPPPAQPGAARPPRQTGPVERRLNSYGRVNGWVFGAWGETSDEVHALVQKLAEARVGRVESLARVFFSSPRLLNWQAKSASSGDDFPLLQCKAKPDFFLTASNC